MSLWYNTAMEKDSQFDLSPEPSLIAFLDLSNMFHWQDTLKWQFSIYHVIKQLFSIKSVKEIRIYYGLNGSDSDLHEPLSRLKVKGKNIYVFGVGGPSCKGIMGNLFKNCSC